MCANPNLPDASEACCDFGSTTATRNSQYDGERMRLSTATNRCSEDSKNLCDFYYVSGSRHKNSMYFWTSNDCELRVKVNSEGRVTVVHHLAESSNEVLHVNDDNENWFRVYWNTYNGYPKAENNCGSLCDVIGNSCLCGIHVVKRQAFNKAPASVSEIMEKLVIGAVDPRVFSPGSYSSTVDLDTNITTHLDSDNDFNQNTIFEFSDEKGQHYFLKNYIEIVLVRGIEGGNTGYSFRNAPQFMSFTPTGK